MPVLPLSSFQKIDLSGSRNDGFSLKYIMKYMENEQLLWVYFYIIGIVLSITYDLLIK